MTNDLRYTWNLALQLKWNTPGQTLNNSEPINHSYIGGRFPPFGLAPSKVWCSIGRSFIFGWFTRSRRGAQSQQVTDSPHNGAAERASNGYRNRGGLYIIMEENKVSDNHCDVLVKIATHTCKICRSQHSKQGSIILSPQ